jgi:hypothetical protein
MNNYLLEKNTTHTETSPEIKTQINKLYTNIENLIVNLYLRWCDESEFENIEDYVIAIKSEMPIEFNFIKMTKRPFGFHFGVGSNAIYAIKITNSSYSWKRIK